MTNRFNCSGLRKVSSELSKYSAFSNCSVLYFSLLAVFRRHSERERWFSLLRIDHRNFDLARVFSPSRGKWSCLALGAVQNTRSQLYPFACSGRYARVNWAGTCCKSYRLVWIHRVLVTFSSD